MNKNLETEYQNMIRAEVPDIWDKIEAKIDAQEAQKKVVAFKKKPTRWKYYVIPAAAALLCAAVAIPVLLNRGAMGGAAATAPASNSTSTGSGMYFAADTVTETSEAACAEETPEAYYDNEIETDNKRKDSVANYSFDMWGSDPTQNAAIAAGDSLQAEPAGATQEAEAEYSDECDAESQETQLVLIVSVNKSMSRIEIKDLAESLDFDITEDENEENSYILTSRRPYGTREMIDVTSYLMEYKGITGVRVDDSVR